jgi:hypothetical protein
VTTATEVTVTITMLSSALDAVSMGEAVNAHRTKTYLNKAVLASPSVGLISFVVGEYLLKFS